MVMGNAEGGARHPVAAAIATLLRRSIHSPHQSLGLALEFTSLYRNSRMTVIVLEMELHYEKFEFATRDEMSSPGRNPVDNGTRGKISRAFGTYTVTSWRHTYNTLEVSALNNLFNHIASINGYLTHTYNVEAQAALPRTGRVVDLHFNRASGQLMSKNGP
ncbi:hypothetical protein RHSIM_Rhsim01G0206900 [Rhododendron simsii]|uniref:Uncharacterized protein n=1 Tax=Rhododendron simsii TaxID=118357 RepID=A0A834LZZ5_RHOSS|nr:hypothetical protein RHSIM_Rhsim01G0206900 [Rhododendron simsii]